MVEAPRHRHRQLRLMPRGIEVLEVGGGEALDRGEDVVESERPVPTDPELAERRIAHGVPEGVETLLEDLLTMCDEEKACTREPRARSTRAR